MIGLSSCEEQVPEMKRTYKLSQSGFYDVTCVTESNNATVSVTKLGSNDKLIVVNVDEEYSDTISTETFYKTYTLSKGKHLLSIECGSKIVGNVFQIIANSKTSLEFTLD